MTVTELIFTKTDAGLATFEFKKIDTRNVCANLSSGREVCKNECTESHASIFLLSNLLENRFKRATCHTICTFVDFSTVQCSRGRPYFFL